MTRFYHLSLEQQLAMPVRAWFRYVREMPVLKDQEVCELAVLTEPIAHAAYASVVQKPGPLIKGIQKFYERIRKRTHSTFKSPKKRTKMDKRTSAQVNAQLAMIKMREPDLNIQIVRGSDKR